MRHVSVDERRARLGARHRLALPAADVNEVANSLVALHATDPASLYMSVMARSENPQLTDLDHALFETRSMARVLAMRRTLFVATREAYPVVEQSSTPAVAAAERKRLEKYLSESDIASPRDWLVSAFDEVLHALAEADGLQARQLSKRVPRLATRITMGSGNWTQGALATSRVLGLMAAEGHIIRGRPAGGWTDRQYEWTRRDNWFEPPLPQLEGAEASVELIRRWLDRFGPGTMTDLKWWTGWTLKQLKAALRELEVEEVALDEGTGLMLAEDGKAIRQAEPWAALLPSLDPTPMGWKEREWYMGAHAEELFDRNGNIGPTVWIDGRIVGGWAHRPDGSVIVELLEPVTVAEQSRIDERRQSLERCLGGAVVKPSFPTPLQKRLSAE